MGCYVLLCLMPRSNSELIVMMNHNIVRLRSSRPKLIQSWKLQSTAIAGHSTKRAIVCLYHSRLTLREKQLRKPPKLWRGSWAGMWVSQWGHTINRTVYSIDRIFEQPNTDIMSNFIWLNGYLRGCRGWLRRATEPCTPFLRPVFALTFITEYSIYEQPNI